MMSRECLPLQLFSHQLLIRHSAYYDGHQGQQNGYYDDRGQHGYQDEYYNDQYYDQGGAQDGYG